MIRDEDTCPSRTDCLAGFPLESLGTRTTVLTLSAGMALLAVAAIAGPSIRRAAHDTD